MTRRMYISREGYEKLKKELEELKGVQRPALSRRISEARDLGDLRENAEYHAAKEQLALLENKIAKLEETLHSAQIVDKKHISGDQVSIYTTVSLKDLKNQRELKYTLVSKEESDFKQKKISIESPVGKALLGKKVGDVVEIQVPAGQLTYQITDIEVAL